MDNVYVASGTLALVVSVALQMAKNSPWFPWLSRNSGKVNAYVSAVAAVLSSMGIAWSFDFDQTTGAVAAAFQFNLYTILHMTGHSIVQFSAQHVAYKGLIVPAEQLGEIRQLLQRVLQPPISDAEAKAAIVDPLAPVKGTV